MEGSDSNESQSCAGCLNDLGDEEYVSALTQDWHKDCFQCSACDAQLSTWYFEKGGLLFCESDYWARFGDICLKCSQIITGPVMAAGSHRFHPECFSCGACSAHLDDAAPYALLDRRHLYCGGCYSGVGTGGGAAGAGEARHAIRAVRVPARAVRLAHSRGVLSIAQLDSSCGVLTLHIGDRVLEVNGSPVRNRPLAEVERALARPDVIQLTIEHNPDTIKVKRSTHHAQENREAVKPIERMRKEEKEVVPKKEEEGKRERLFKRKGVGVEGGKVRVIKRRQTPASPQLGEKERSSSMSKLLDAVDGEERSGVLCDLSRARSFRAEPAPGQTVFRPADLLQGELLGTGFFGHVYKVTHRATNEVMVLKQLYRVDEEAQRNFLKEVAVLRSLRHPNVLRFIGVLYRDRRLHLVTEYVAGGTLHDLLQNSNRALSWVERVRLSLDVAAGVGYLHRMSVIHRDLNSHNCLVRGHQDMTVIVADFGLARIVQPAPPPAPAPAHAPTSGPTLAPATGTLRRKRYTVVGNPYWMAPEMMNGNVYDEKVDVFSFGIILCEIIGRVSADPDYLPRRADFGLNEALFLDKFCATCPQPFYSLAFLACHLEPDARPSFEVMEGWLQSLVLHLSQDTPTTALLADITQYAADHAPPRPLAPPITLAPPTLHKTPRDCNCSCEELDDKGIVKSESSATLEVQQQGAVPLGKCVSAGHLHPPALRAAPRPARRSRSHHALALAPGYILRAATHGFDITKVDDISEWLDPPPLKRTSPDSHLNHLLADTKSRRIEDAALPAFLRNQSVEGLETDHKHPVPFCRHYSSPEHDTTDNLDTDSSDDELDIRIDCNPKILTDMVKTNLLAKKASYNIDSNLNCDLKEAKIPEKIEKNSLAKKLLSPKLSRLFKPVEIRKEEEKSKSKFFVQRPASPIRCSYRVRPSEDSQRDVLKSDLKLASLGKPMTPIFRRNLDKQDFDGRYSYRDKSDVTYKKSQEKFSRVSSVEKGRNLTPVPEKGKEEKLKRREGITRSNYVRLANLKISKELEPECEAPPERVI